MFIDLVKSALRIGTDAFDDELQNLIDAAVADMGIAGVINIDTTTDPPIKTAVITYCKLHFGIAEDADRLQRSYDEQKGQLSTASGYTDFGGV